MKYFNNTDVMPIYQSFVLINWMVSGLVLLDESKLYTWGELFRLGASCLLVVLGIYVITLKQSEMVRLEESDAKGLPAAEPLLSSNNSDKDSDQQQQQMQFAADEAQV